MMVAELMQAAMALGNKGDSVGCTQALEKVLLADPNYAEAWNNRAGMLLKLGHPFDAIISYDRAIDLKPNMAELYNNRGVAYVEIDRHSEAMANYEQAIALKPEFSEAYMNIGIIYGKHKNIPKAIEYYRRATELKHDNVDAHFGLAVNLLENGQFEEGWKEFEWRWKSSQMADRGLKVPMWEGEEANTPGDVLLLYSEQGHGDALQFIRYVPLIQERWKGEVHVEVRAPLARLAKTSGADAVVIYGEKLSERLKCCLPMMSAPRVLTTTVASIPGVVPYLSADSHRISIWRERLKALPAGPKIGICWAGGARPLQPIANAVDQRRSTTLAEFAPLAQIPGISWVSLQIGDQSGQVKTPPAGMTIGDWSDEIGDFYDTAALIECLDMVITVDTSVLHLAGALGKPVWLLSRYDNCWRWMGRRSDSPWYPSLRQFIQKEQGDWAGVMEEVSQALRKHFLQINSREKEYV